MKREVLEAEKLFDEAKKMKPSHRTSGAKRLRSRKGYFKLKAQAMMGSDLPLPIVEN
jgi:hypothetical protein